MDNLTGYQDFDAKYKEVVGSLLRLSSIVEIEDYQNKLKKIYRDFHEAYKNSKNPFQNTAYAQAKETYNQFSYAPHIKKLALLAKDISDNLQPFYYLDELNKKVTLELNSEEFNYEELVKDNKDIIDTISEIKEYHEEKKKIIINNAYENLLQSLAYEALLKKEKLLTYLKYKNSPVILENLGVLIIQKMEGKSNINILSNQIRQVKEEGMGFNDLTAESLKESADKVVTSKYKNDKKNYKTKTAELRKETKELKRDYNLAKDEYWDREKEHKKTKKGVYRSRAIKAVAGLLPVIFMTGGLVVGRFAMKPLYKTYATEEDIETGEVLKKYEMDDKYNSNPYEAEVREYGPWQKTYSGKYKRKVKIYSYGSFEYGKDYNVTLNDLNEDLVLRTNTTEHKDNLSKGDSTTDTTYSISFRNQDRSKEYYDDNIIPAMLTSFLLLIFPEIFAIFAAVDPEYEKSDLTYSKNKLEEIYTKLKEAQEREIQLKKEAQEILDNYGILPDDLVFPNIDIDEETKKHNTLGKKHI